MIFLWGPAGSAAHDPDVKALLRIAVVYDIPVANNLATADFMLNSKIYERTLQQKDREFQQDHPGQGGEDEIVGVRRRLRVLHILANVVKF